MKKETLLSISIIICSFFTTITWSMDDQACTPKNKRKRVSYAQIEQKPLSLKFSEEDSDQEFTPGTPPESELKRLKVSKTSISSPSVKRWPRLLEMHQYRPEFITELISTHLNNGTTLLHKAMKQKQSTPSVVSCTIDLINAGADLAKQDKEGDTPLHRWVMSGSNAPEAINTIASVLLKKTLPDVNSLKNGCGSTPLHLTCSKGLVNFDKFKTFLTWNMPIDTENNQSQTILHRLATSGPDTSGDKQKIMTLINNHDLSSFINVQDDSEKTALHYAVEHGDKLTFNILIKSPQIDLDIRDNEGNTPLHKAVMNIKKPKKNASYFIKELIRFGACKGIKNSLRNKPKDLVPDKYNKLKKQLS